MQISSSSANKIQRRLTVGVKLSRFCGCSHRPPPAPPARTFFLCAIASVNSNRIFRRLYPLITFFLLFYISLHKFKLLKSSTTRVTIRVQQGIQRDFSF